MTETEEFRGIKTIAKRYARANRIALHQALDLVAGQLGFPNWVKLAAAGKKGWTVNEAALAGLEAFERAPMPKATFRLGNDTAMDSRLAHVEQVDGGMIGEHAYRLHDAMGDAVMSGEGWSIRVPENSGAIPTVETYASSGADCPVLDPEFLQTALDIAETFAESVRGGIAKDWPRRSTKPDLEGVVRHPLSGQESSTWFCYHCDGKITGAQIAGNLWHCPECQASPLDIHHVTFWSDDLGQSFRPVASQATAREASLGPQVVDGRPKLELDAKKLELLLRSALIDDATNPGERMGALHAEISVDDDLDVWIILDVDLWPEEKTPVQAIAVAKLLGVDIEIACTAMTIPFAWPGLGTVASSTLEYTRMMLDAYADRGSMPERPETQ